MGKFQKPFIDRPGVLDPVAGDPEGYVTNDGMWAAVPIIGCKAFAIMDTRRKELVWGKNLRTKVTTFPFTTIERMRVLNKDYDLPCHT